MSFKEFSIETNPCSKEIKSKRDWERFIAELERQGWNNAKRKIKKATEYQKGCFTFYNFSGSEKCQTLEQWSRKNGMHKILFGWRFKSS